MKKSRKKEEYRSVKYPWPKKKYINNDTTLNKKNFTHFKKNDVY